jgi:hypothetical protein
MGGHIIYKGEIAIGGYSVVQAPPDPRQARQAPHSFTYKERVRRSIGTGALIDKDLISDGRHVVAKGERVVLRPIGLVAEGVGRALPYEISVGETKDGHAAFTDLASMEPTIEGVLEFAGRWGKLMPRSSVGGWRTVGDYYCAKLFVDNALAHLTSPILSTRKKFFKRSLVWLYGPDGLGLIKSRFGWSSTNPFLYLETRELLQFCLFDLILQHTGGGTPFARCPGPGCGNWLHRRGQGRPKDYCSDACRVRHSRARKRRRRRHIDEGDEVEVF